MAGVIRWRMAYAVFLFYAATGTGGLAQTFTKLVDFDRSNGAFPTSIVQGRDGQLWGSTNDGGDFNCGTAFNMTADAAFTTVLSFDCITGKEAQGLILGTDGEFYGVTFFGGTINRGTLFALTPSGSLTILSNFDEAGAGSNPVGQLTEGADGNFYGATYAGGSPIGYGSVFKITPSGTLTTLYAFDFTHGAQPYAGLVQGADGDFYGTTYSGGAGGGGTVFKITQNGSLTVLYDFRGSANGFSPVASLVQGSDGNFYGTTVYGGQANDGTAFSITPTRIFTSLYAFGGADGRAPVGALVQGTDGDFYGTTAYGGANEMGTIFKITSSGTLTTLHEFDGTDGADPFYLFQGTNGKFYGITGIGGASNNGTVFSLDMGLDPFVQAVTNSGKVGTTVELLGQGFDGATAVSFNGTDATFAVDSDTYLTVVVPSGATTGFISVTTTSGTLMSNKEFVVISASDLR